MSVQSLPVMTLFYCQSGAAKFVPEKKVIVSVIIIVNNLSQHTLIVAIDLPEFPEPPALPRPQVNESRTEEHSNKTNAEASANGSVKSQQSVDEPEQVDDSQVKTKAVNDENSQNNLIGEPSHKCYYERMIYEDGSQWKTERDDCEMCFCQVLSHFIDIH